METYSSPPECRASREVTKAPALSLTRGEMPRLKVNMVKEEPDRRTYRGRCRRSSARDVKGRAAMYPRDLEEYTRRLFRLSQSDADVRSSSFLSHTLPLSRCTVQNGIIYVRESAAIIRRKCTSEIAAATGVPRADIFLVRSDQSTLTSAPSLFLECWEWFISVTKKVESTLP